MFEMKGVWCVLNFFYHGATAPVVQGPPPPLSRIHDPTQLDTPHSAGLLWKSDQLVAETFT